MRREKRFWIITYILLLAVMLVSMGCAKKDTTDGKTYFHHSIAGSTQDSESAAQENTQPDLYLITEVDQMEETMRLYRYANGIEYRYAYGTGTRFYDEYGTRTTVSSFEQGLLITIGDVNPQGILCDASLSDAAWVYEDVKKFQISDQMQMFQIGDSKYHYSENTYVFSEGERVAMADVQQGDTLCVVGMDKEILSVRITTAQGILALENTTLFDGSFLQLGERIFTEITPDLHMQVAEGTYQLRVANNGWGGSTEVTIARGQTTTVDLDTLKGKGPKMGKIKFLIDVKDAVLMVDDKETDYAEAVSLAYGKHTIAVYAEGYDAWRRNLYVNSAESTIIINLKDEQDSTETEADKQKSSETVDNSRKDSTEKDETKDQTGDTQSSESKKRQEELDLIKDLLSSMTKSSSIVSN